MADCSSGGQNIDWKAAYGVAWLKKLFSKSNNQMNHMLTHGNLVWETAYEVGTSRKWYRRMYKGNNYRKEAKMEAEL